MKQLPPPKFHDNLKFVPSRIAQAITYSLLILTSSTTWAQSFEYINDSPESIQSKPIIEAKDNKEISYDSITLKFNPYIAWNSYVMTVNNGSLTVNGDTIIEVNAMMKEDQTNPGENEGIYVLYAGGNQAKADLSSNVDIVLKQDDPNIPFENVGLNVLYTRYGGEISIGNESSETRMWTISSQPDLISAKDGGSVIIHSKRNQLVGSIDFLGAQSPEHGDSIVSITFEGSDSYWFGDEQSWQNADIS